MAPTGTDARASACRYLNPEEKRHTLAEWEQRKATPLPMDGRVLGGRGYPDADMIPWCDRLNDIPGVCTLQSCAGHGEAESGGSLTSGHLWLLLDRAMSAAFNAAALELAAYSEHIERVSRIYTPWGQEIAAIEFAGNERGLLDESMQIVLDFFHSLLERGADDR